jgi:hypothetical protein
MVAGINYGSTKAVEMSAVLYKAGMIKLSSCHRNKLYVNIVQDYAKNRIASVVMQGITA